MTSAVVERTGRPSLCEAFSAFHQSNPHVYTVLVRLTREYLDHTGRSRVGLSLIYGRARWELALRSSDPRFTLNNNHAAFYARLIMARETDLDGAFEVRRALADEGCPGILQAAPWD